MSKPITTAKELLTTMLCASSDYSAAMYELGRAEASGHGVAQAEERTRETTRAFVVARLKLEDVL